ncbi:MAG: hypothetical protein IJW74_05605 [Oscillospiraceae bacterium]|nr:hypothetical protein [Oscillospiraceae bacterium]
MPHKNDVKNSITLPKQHINSLQALRVLAFLGIFVGHSGIGGLGPGVFRCL